MNKLFNIHLFQDENPFIKQVFQKDFDIFFFLNFPKLNELPNLGTYNFPAAFLSNIGQKQLLISTTSGIENHNFIFNNYCGDDIEFIELFNEKFGNEQYLFWNSEIDSWAMISDAKAAFAIVGINWEIADQVKLFMEYLLISPLQAIEKLGIQENGEIFFQNFKPKSILINGSEKNPKWVNYYFDCYVENENAKLFYWEQFEQLYFLLSKVLDGLKGIDMYACQSFWRQYYRNKQWYTTGENAPVGGWQAFTHKNCHKVATKFLTANRHLQLQFEGKIDESDQLIRAQKKGLIGFTLFWIYASKEKRRQKGSYSECFFRINDSGGKRANPINQQFEFCLKEGLIEESKVKKFIDELIKIGFAKKVCKLCKPYLFVKYLKDHPVEILSMINSVKDDEDIEVYYEMHNSS